LSSPPYVAVIVCVPRRAIVMLKVAVPSLKVAVPMERVPAVKVIVPVGMTGALFAGVTCKRR
jgi:hypothetical protein